MSNFIESLKAGKVQTTFKRVDGTLKTAILTLKDGVTDSERDNAVKGEYIHAFEPEGNRWNTIKEENLVSFVQVA